MQTIDCISNIGVVEEVKEQSVVVGIVAQSACASCHAKGGCSSMDSAEKHFEISSNNQTYSIGEKVMIKMHKSLGTKAVLLSYAIPFVLFITTLILTFSLLKSEGLAGLFSILSIVAYFLAIWLFRKKIETTFNFEIEKL